MELNRFAGWMFLWMWGEEQEVRQDKGLVRQLLKSSCFSLCWRTQGNPFLWKYSCLTHVYSVFSPFLPRGYQWMNLNISMNFPNLKTVCVQNTTEMSQRSKSKTDSCQLHSASAQLSQAMGRWTDRKLLSNHSMLCFALLADASPGSSHPKHSPATLTYQPNFPLAATLSEIYWEETKQSSDSH